MYRRLAIICGVGPVAVRIYVQRTIAAGAVEAGCRSELVFARITADASCQRATGGQSRRIVFGDRTGIRGQGWDVVDWRNTDIQGRGVVGT